MYTRNNRAQVEPGVFIPQCTLQSAAPPTHAWSAAACALSIAAESYGEPPPHQTLWVGGQPTAYLQFALSGVVRSRTSQLPGALAPLLRAQESESSGIGEHAAAACRQVCQRTNVPKNWCAVAVSQRSPSRRSRFSSRTAPLGKRHFQETAQRCLRLRADLSRPCETRESPKAWT